MTPKFKKWDHAVIVEEFKPGRPGIDVSIVYGLGMDPDGGPFRIEGFKYAGAPQPTSQVVKGHELLTRQEWALVAASRGIAYRP